MFKIGDAVRVKAGVIWIERKRPVRTGELCYPCKEQRGRKLEVYCTKDWSDEDTVVYFHKHWPSGNAEGYGDGISQRFLEPWNDSEEWDGEKWVPKKLADEITVNGVTYVRKVAEKTNAEIAEEILNRSKDEMEMYEFEHEDKSAFLRIASVLRTGNIITVVYDASGD